KSNNSKTSGATVRDREMRLLRPCLPPAMRRRRGHRTGPLLDPGICFASSAWSRDAEHLRAGITAASRQGVRYGAALSRHEAGRAVARAAAAEYAAGRVRSAGGAGG